MTDLAKEIDLITSKLSEQLDTLESEYQRWNNYKSDYDALEEQLKTLPDETKRSAMIPIGKLAFMPGAIIHTNEILVLLGEQYFAERSAKQAIEILGRRREVVIENLRLVEAQLNSFKAKKDSVNSSVLPSDQVNEEGLPIMEIREELPPAEEEKVEEKKKLIQEVPNSTAVLPESVVRARKLMQEADEKIKQNQMRTEEDKALFDLLRQLEEEEEEEEEEELVTKETPVTVKKATKHVKFQDEVEEEEEVDKDEFDDFSDDDEDDDRYDREISDNMFDRFADDEEYATDGVVDQEDFTSYEEETPKEEESPKIRSPADIFKNYKAKDDYPSLDDEKEGEKVDLNELIQAARQTTEPYYRSSDGSVIPSMKPTHPDPNGILVANKTKLDNKIMKGAVLERETAPVDLEQVEEDMDLREISSSYQQKRQSMLAATGGFSFAPKPEFEVIEEELPLPKKGKEPKEKEEEEAPPPKKMSRFKAARLGLQFEQ